MVLTPFPDPPVGSSTDCSGGCRPKTPQQNKGGQVASQKKKGANNNKKKHFIVPKNEKNNGKQEGPTSGKAGQAQASVQKPQAVGQNGAAQRPQEKGRNSPAQKPPVKGHNGVVQHRQAFRQNGADHHRLLGGRPNGRVPHYVSVTHRGPSFQPPAMSRTGPSQRPLTVSTDNRVSEPLFVDAAAAAAAGAAPLVTPPALTVATQFMETDAPPPNCQAIYMSSYQAIQSSNFHCPISSANGVLAAQSMVRMASASPHTNYMMAAQPDPSHAPCQPPSLIYPMDTSTAPPIPHLPPPPHHLPSPGLLAPPPTPITPTPVRIEETLGMTKLASGQYIQHWGEDVWISVTIPVPDESREHGAGPHNKDQVMFIALEPERAGWLLIIALILVNLGIKRKIIT
ncbi:pollen-specific leucine-rich repeat extensin-like protein 1 [Aplysia californica]|uniref:Pollen-specific leucine-rich repeat extensin-like protein 1 n=1 Tax=Aplysia californica TaxID=6500 RepID=A0ABM1A7K8_APLCA|nr:pollen-specific leucine-rich repeat extensin-like protein 1 [Aplysia californica]XP_012942389.1 pollen-specific leucine-rich repeat extensin-like protein 1 [Aplysia californica]